MILALFYGAKPRNLQRKLHHLCGTASSNYQKKMSNEKLLMGQFSLVDIEFADQKYDTDPVIYTTTIYPR